MPFVPLKTEALRMGLFVKIEGSWFNHPFPTNSFKISTAKDLDKLKKLTSATLLFDPDRSDPQTVTLDRDEDSSKNILDVDIPEETSPTPTDLQPYPSDEIEKETEDHIQRKLAQHEAFRVYQEHIKEVGGRFQAVVQEGKQMIQDVLSGRPRGLRTAQRIVENLYEMIEESNHSRALLNLMGSNDSNEEFFLHSLNVCSLSLMVGQDLDLRREELEKLAIGALFHDVGELKFPVEKLLRRGSMSRVERHEFISSHSRYGVDIVENISNFPYEGLEVIRQHHERLNGTGLPDGKKDEQISKLAKIVMVVDEYDELCHHQDPAQSLVPSEALSYLYAKCRHTLWQEAVVSLVRQLGVYPPGSLVTLSNQKVGMVTSVNLHDRLRPILLVHEDQALDTEPSVLNLGEEDPSLTIQQSIHPVNLSPRIRECLNPRRIISYFPSPLPQSPDLCPSHPLPIQNGNQAPHRNTH